MNLENKQFQPCFQTRSKWSGENLFSINMLSRNFLLFCGLLFMKPSLLTISFRSYDIIKVIQCLLYGGNREDIDHLFFLMLILSSYLV
jgi:hypothetical protein